MAIFSSHLLDATNGSHAKNVNIIIYQIKKNGDKEIFFETKRVSLAPQRPVRLIFALKTTFFAIKALELSSR